MTVTHHKVKNDKGKPQPHPKTGIDMLSAFSFQLKAVKLPKNTIVEKKREIVDQKLYRSRVAKVQERSRRVIYIHESLVHSKPKLRKIAQYPADFTDNTQLYSVLDLSDE